MESGQSELMGPDPPSTHRAGSCPGEMLLSDYMRRVLAESHSATKACDPMAARSQNVCFCMDVSKNRGTPKWMVCMENPIRMHDLGVPLFLETPI